jgi:hypothetical protein
MQAPFIISVVAPTGTGKTYNVAALLHQLKDGAIPLVHRFNSKGHNQGEPYSFKQCHYIGVKADDSFDTTHNENVARILKGGDVKGFAKTLKELGAQAAVGANKEYSLMKPQTPANMIPDYINSIKKEGTCLVIDDMSSYLDEFSKKAETELKNLFQAGSHHEGLSLVFVYQTVPKGPLGKTLFNSSHYIMFPIPQFSSETGLGVLVGDFRTIMHMVSGFSKDLLASFEKLVRAAPDDKHSEKEETDSSEEDEQPDKKTKGSGVGRRPNYIIYNKFELRTDDSLQKNPAVTSHQPIKKRRRVK